MYCWPLPSLRDDQTLMSPWRTCFDLARTNTHNQPGATSLPVRANLSDPCRTGCYVARKKNTSIKREKNMQEGHCKEKSSKHAPRALANVVTRSLMTARRTRCDVAGKKTKTNERKAHRKLTARKTKKIHVPAAFTTSRQTLSCLPGAPP